VLRAKDGLRIKPVANLPAMDAEENPCCTQAHLYH